MVTIEVNNGGKLIKKKIRIPERKRAHKKQKYKQIKIYDRRG